jgi:hypothetical protein
VPAGIANAGRFHDLGRAADRQPTFGRVAEAQRANSPFVSTDERLHRARSPRQLRDERELTVEFAQECAAVRLQTEQ